MRDRLPWTWLSGPDADRARSVAAASPPRSGYDGVRLLRAVGVAAPPAITWRWMTQLQVAPYSYDLLDNRGRRSPRRLLPGLGDPEVGHAMLSIFEVVAVTPGSELVLELRDRAARGVFGPLVCSYRTDPVPGHPDRSVLSGRLDCAPPTTALARRRIWLLGWGDLVMMRKQLRTLARLAEQSAAGDLRP